MSPVQYVGTALALYDPMPDFRASAPVTKDAGEKILQNQTDVRLCAERHLALDHYMFSVLIAHWAPGAKLDYKASIQSCH